MTQGTASRGPALAGGHPPLSSQDPQAVNVFRQLAFYSALGVVFLRFSLLHEALTYYTGVNSHVLYFFTIPAMAGVAVTGGLRRMFSARPAFYWLAFVAWLFLATPFSVWRGDSTEYVLTYLRAEFPMLLLLAGLPIGWKECRMVLYTISFAGIYNVLSGIFSGQTYGTERVGLQFGTIFNPNDYAGHLILVLPVVLFMVVHPPRFPIIRTLVRCAGLAAFLYGLYLALESGSRGALIALLAGMVFVFIKARKELRTGLLVMVPVAAALLIVALPNHTISRFQSYATDSPSAGEAQESAALRRQLLEESLAVSITHPLLGVGPGQFGNFEGTEKASDKTVAAWITAHNSYTQISSDVGIPGLLFYLGGIISPFLLIQRTWKRVRATPGFEEISAACFSLSVSYVGFCIVILFLNFGYFFYLPALAGLAVSMQAAIEWELAARQAARKTLPVPVLTPPLSPVAALAAPKSPAAPNRFRFNRYR